MRTSLWGPTPSGGRSRDQLTKRLRAGCVSPFRREAVAELRRHGVVPTDADDVGAGTARANVQIAGTNRTKLGRTTAGRCPGHATSRERTSNRTGGTIGKDRQDTQPTTPVVPDRQ
jgi:hypothetical protein